MNALPQMSWNRVYGERRVVSRLSASGRVDPFALVRETPGAGARRDWHVDVELDFDPAELAELVLRCSEGFLVDGGDGAPFGVVESVSIDERSGRAVSLEIGVSHSRVVDLRADEVAKVLPLERRLVVRGRLDREPGD
jgi:hypothetical protein